VRFAVYTVVTVVLVAGCGVWLRWASLPVLLAFGAGMRVERIRRYQRRGLRVVRVRLEAVAGR
jgi:hypothetical protein